MTESESLWAKAGIDMSLDWLERFTPGRLMESHRIREEHIRRFGFAVLDSKTVEHLRPYAPFIEVGAGTGYWTHTLVRAGMDAIATDLYPGETNRYPFKEVKWGKVERMAARTAASRYSDRTLLMVWPDYAKRWAYEAVKAYRGRYVIYVGEGDGGCTADDNFHRLIGDSNKWCHESTYLIPQFDAIHDQLYIFRRAEAVNGRKFRDE